MWRFQLILFTGLLSLGVYAETEGEAPELLFAVGGAWELKAPENTTPSPWIGVEKIAHYDHQETDSRVELFKWASSLSNLEAVVFQFETLYLEDCFFVKNSSLEIEPLDEITGPTKRRRMIPLCWQAQESRWEWSFLEFIEVQDSPIFLARYQGSAAPDFRLFDSTEKLFSRQLGLCRPSELQSCYQQIQKNSLAVETIEHRSADLHPRFYRIERSRALAPEENAAAEAPLGFSQASIEPCQEAREEDRLIERIQQVAFQGVQSLDGQERRCFFDLTEQNPQYACVPTSAGGLKTVYRFFRSERACSQQPLSSTPLAGGPESLQN